MEANFILIFIQINTTRVIYVSAIYEYRFEKDSKGKPQTNIPLTQNTTFPRTHLPNTHPTHKNIKMLDKTKSPGGNVLEQSIPKQQGFYTSFEGPTLNSLPGKQKKIT